ncbi:MAG: DUF342 domain-containing protein [Planctomycetes bacterium]|nr:DUF342 domain-containing protein [Planctomycetota bacterium]
MSEKEDTVLREVREDSYFILLLINEDKTEVKLKFVELEPGADVSQTTIRDILDEAGVVYGVLSNGIKDLVEQISEGTLEASEEEVYSIAKGKSACHGEDGRLDYLVDPSPDEVHFDLDADEVIDYKNTNLIQNVMEEQHLATLIQPEDPENGIDVFGNTINANEGVPLKLKLGSNVVMDGDKLFAQCGGRFIREGEELSVSGNYQVRGDVDLTIGNVNFVGYVNVTKDILDDFAVFGKEGVEVGGIVGAATVESDTKLIFNGGMNGKGKGFARCQGSIESKYLNEVTSISWGDISIAKSIMNSTVKTKGKVDVPNGSIIGGEVSALMGIDVGVVGSDLGTMTSLIAGQDYELEDRIKAFESQLLEIGHEIDRIDRIIGPILANKDKLMSLPLDKKKAIKGLLEQLKHYKEEQGRIRIESEALQKESAKVCVKEIRVRKILYSGVRITIGNCKKLIKMEIKGPVRLREDQENDTISITNLTL